MVESAKRLSNEDYRKRVELSPIVSFDLIIVDKEGKILVGKRKNEPAKGFFFVPGGAILKDEPFKDAIKRISLAELGLELELKDMEFLGPYEHFYENNFHDDLCSTHYVSFGFKHVLDETEKLGVQNLLDQHSEYVWMSVNEIIERGDVHEYTKAYFKKDSFASLL